MLVAQISDTHIVTPEADRPAAELRADCLRRCVADINRQRPDAVVFTGDTVQHGREDEYARLRDLLEPLAPPLYFVPGNRDDRQLLHRAFVHFDYLPRDGEFLHYAIDSDELRLVALDSTLRGERKGRFCEARQAWLDQALGAALHRPTVLFIHHPPFDVGDHYIGGYRRPEEAAALAAIVGRHPQVAALFCGHVHWPVACGWAGTQARIMPSVAVDLRNGIDEDDARGRPVYFLHEVSKNGEIASYPRMVDESD